MLTLGRDSGQYVLMGDDIVVQVVKADGQLRLVIDAPRNMPIVRGENYEKTHEAPECIRRLRAKARS